MKSISCRELGGACDMVFRGRSFEEVAEQSQIHGAQMKDAADPEHMQAMDDMMAILESGKVDEWITAKMDFFELLPDED